MGSLESDAVFLVLRVITAFPTDLLLTCWDELVFLSLPGAAPPPCPLAFLYFSRQSGVEPRPAYKQGLKKSCPARCQGSSALILQSAASLFCRSP